ncbi:MAG: HDOD domain-containing protein [Deltaproteobacteria bacterium]|jgi:HD-like signal output (HDOD) protein|nr:HDOD domain-containing protein [Deltaproteobacteria bacterium]
MRKVQELATSYRGRILEAKNLPALPDAVNEITRLMATSSCSTNQMAEIIERDQALALKVLKMVNSPIYGFPGRITSVKNALVLLGINVIRGLIISSAVFDAFNKYMIGLWTHSVACSLAAVEVARAADLPRPEEYSIVGLLHDMGKVVFAMQIPAARAEVDALVSKDDIMFRDGEKIVLGFTHDKINAWMCEHWNLPLMLKEALVYHHDPMNAQFHPEAAAVVHVSDFMARLFECGFGGDDNVPPLDARALRLLKINHQKIEYIMGELVDIYSDKTNLSII